MAARNHPEGPFCEEARVVIIVWSVGRSGMAIAVKSVLIAAAAILGAMLGTAAAQTPPSSLDASAYEGLHAAAYAGG